MWVKFGTHMWGGSKAATSEAFARSWVVEELDILLPCKRKKAVHKVTFGLWAPHPPCVYFSRFLCGEQLTQDFASPTALMPFDTRGKPFYNRPSDCCFRLACSVALLLPIAIRAFAPESVGRLAVRGNSTIRQSNPPYGFVNRVSTFEWIPKALTSPISRGYVWFCFLFILTHHVNHTIQATGRGSQGHEAAFLHWSPP